ncbi:MAG: response regulator, partial [Ruminiclostridium sp.]|nr:response regulator [Ruminiclostridium sp.]
HKDSLRLIREFVNFSTLDERLKGNTTLTEEFKNIKDVWCRARFIVTKRDSQGKLSKVLWLVESIDEEKRRRDELYATARNLNFQVSSISNIFMVVYDVDLIADTFSVIKSENRIVNDLVGDRRDDAQFTVRVVMEALTDESSLDEMMRFINFDTLESRLGYTQTVALEFMTKTKKWIRIRFLASQRTNTGGLSHVLWLAEDIDSEKKDRDALIDMSERAIAASEAKSSFLSNMSHEIRTPINAVLGMNEMILRECDDEDILAYSESIRTAGNTLLGIINDILDFSKIEAGKMEIIPVDYDLSSVINDLVNMIQTRAEEKGLILALEIDRDIPKLLHGDEVRIKQVITNILTNAVKYTERGSVTFCIEYEKISGDPKSIYLDISVRDTGIGIKPEDMKKLFSEFERIEEERNRNVEGTGLGMNITKRLLEMMGSSLKVESVYGIGSVFSFRLKQTVIGREPLGDYEKTYRESLSEHKKYREMFTAPDAQVLVIDDTYMNLMVFRSLLKKTGVKIDTAVSGDEGLGLSYRKKYDIIFLDHMMPDKDGIETLREMRARTDDPNRDTPVVCLTANAISGAREQYISAGFDDYLTKPIDSARLEEMLIEYLPPEKVVVSSGANAAETVQKAPKTEKKAKDPEPEEDDGVIPRFVRDNPELNTEAGIANCGGEEFYIETLVAYADMVNVQIGEVEKYRAAGDIKNLTVKIHAMKSTAKLIGANDIGAFAQRLENAGKAGDIKAVEEELDALIERCKKLGECFSQLSMG